jgi:hypothetical protein
MKLDDNTIHVLKNFSTINQSILVKPGNVLRTISPSKTVIAKATLTQEFASQFAIYDVSRFLGVVSQFENPELDFADKHVVIGEGEEKCQYTFTDPSMIVAAPEKEINLPNPEVAFRLTEEKLTKATRAMGVLGLPELAVTGKDGKIYLQAVDVKGTTADVFSIEVGTTAANFRMVFRAENMKIMHGDYDVSISSRGLSHFKGNNIEYWIAVESSSVYQG